MNRKTNNLCWLVFVLISLAGSSPSQQSENMSVDPKSYSTVNPYAEVDWGSYGHYKASLHTHTNQSDGSLAPSDVIDRYHALGYSVLSLTDHDTVGPPDCDKHQTTWPWQKFGRNPDQLQMVAIEGNEVGSDDMGSYFNNYGNKAVYDSIYKWDSSAYTYKPVDSDAAHKATRVAENTLQEIRSRDGLAVMFHTGIYMHPADWYVRLFLDFDNLLGIEAYNHASVDSWPWSMTLWDELLTELMPTRPVWGFSNDDAHMRLPGEEGNAYPEGYAYQVLLLRELTEKAVRKSMEKGCFYFCKVYEAGKEAPAIQSIRIDKTAGGAATLTIEAKDGQEILWISRGRIVATGSTFDIRKSRGAGRYVRAQIRGKNGYTYTQPFSLPLN